MSGSVERAARRVVRAGPIGVVFRVAAAGAAQIPVAQTVIAQTGTASVATLPADSVLTLEMALRTALRANPALRIAREQVRVEQGAATGVRGLFDATLETSLVGGRFDELALSNTGAPTALGDISTLRRETIDYRVALQKPFANGLIVVPSVSVSQVGQAAFGEIPVNRAQAGVTAVLPLSRNRGGGVWTMQQRSAETAVDAAELEQRQAGARTALDLGVAYWNYAAADERLAALRYAESRAQTLVDETAELVRGDARPAADLIQFRGNLSSKRAQRAGAEQSVAQARQQLGIILGIPPSEIIALPRALLNVAGTTAPYNPGTGQVSEATLTLDSLPVNADQAGGAWATTRLVEILSRRTDVRAAQLRALAADQQRAATQSGLRPRMDLQISVAYAGLDRGPGFGEFIAPLWRNTRGASTTVQLQYELPTRNYAARGRAEQADAIAAQAMIVQRDRARQVESAVAVAAAGAFRGRAALIDAASAVRIARDVVENEKQKFRLGVSTQIDVIFAEDALSNALLAEIAARASYAASVAVLRLESGALAAAGDDSRELARLLSTDTDLRRAP